MAVEVRPLAALVILGAILAAASVGSLVVTETVDEPYDPSTDATIDLNEDQSLWLYTSRRESFDQWTLALNVVVYGPPERTERVLLEGGWEETEEDEQDIDYDERPEVRWEQADGAQRFVYLTDGDDGQWLSESYQLHDGDYLGSRHHVRAYTPPEEGSWTALQAHDEYWDWFSARHVVTSVESSQTHVGSTFQERGDRETVRIHTGGEDLSNFNGWVTVVNPREGSPAPAFLVGTLLGVLGIVTTRTLRLRAAVRELGLRQELGTVLLATSIIALFMSVRLSAVGLERTVDISPKVIAAVLSPALFIGVPILTYLLGRQLDRAWAFAGGSIGFLVAIFIDFTYLGVAMLPLDVLVHRGGLAVALGFIAVGASRTERRDPDEVSHVQLGVLLWLAATVQPLLRYTPIPA